MPPTSSKTLTLISPPALQVKIERGEAPTKEFVFKAPFRIGRDEECQVCIKDYMVSRVHAEVTYEEGQWWIRDLNSTNGTFIAGERVSRVPITAPAQIVFGVNGPGLLVEVERMPVPPPAEDRGPSLTRYIHHYFADSPSEQAGEHTMMVRRAFQKVQKKKSQIYLRIIAGVSVLFLLAAAFAVYKQLQVSKQQALAQNLFYEMKELDVTLSRLEQTIALTGDPQAVAEIQRFRAKRKELENNYDQYIDALGIYGKDMSEEERLIFRVARLWGECEVNMPEGFVREVKNYIRKWQSTDRLKKALARAQQNGYAPKIAAAMLSYHMPPQFFYLGLQESDFNPNRCGPKTRFGIAKGMWQFIPATARQYGLRTGPLLEVPHADPRDERHNFEKSTDAAAQYLRDIYNTDAQASGLLVMASYNWGENNVKALIRQMPENPRERNFWRLLQGDRVKLPAETYDYVFYIISAAVIGENPKLFGFDFENPLAEAALQR